MRTFESTALEIAAPLHLKMYEKLLFLGVVLAAEETKNILRGTWELIPIVEDMNPETAFEPCYIDDTPDERDSTVDMFLFVPRSNVEWVASIRGSGKQIKRKQVPNSRWHQVKVAKFDNDPYPDLVIVTPNQRTVRYIKNQVRKNIEIIKREQFTSEKDNSGDLEDWVGTDLYTVGKDTRIVDFFIQDMNHDGKPEIVMALRHKDGVYTILEMIFTEFETMEFNVLELWFENQGILQLLGACSLNNENKLDLVYLSSEYKLEYVENKDPSYNKRVMVDTPLATETRLKRFYSVDFNNDGETEFIFLDNEGVKFLYLEKSSRTWQLEFIYPGELPDIALAHITKPSNSDLILVHSDYLTWLSTFSELKEPMFSWRDKGYLEFPIEFENSYQWKSLLVSDLENSGEVDFLLHTLDSIYWGRKKKLGLEGLGWEPNFWIYLMSYVILMSMAAGLFHSYYSEHLEEELLLSNLPSNLPEEWVKRIEAMSPNEKRKELRKITY